MAESYTYTGLHPDIGAVETPAASNILIYNFKGVAPDIGAVESAAAGQFAIPANDLSTGSWATNAGVQTGLYATLDESVPDDTDYIQSALSPGSVDRYEVALTSITPGSFSGEQLNYRIGKSAPGGDRIDMTVYLMQGTTVIASWTHTNVGTLTTYSQALTSAQIAAITSYGTLRLRVDAIKV